MVHHYSDPLPSDDDLHLSKVAKLQQPSTQQEYEQQQHIPSLGQLETFPSELLIIISSNLYAKDLNALGRVNSVFLKLLFNQTRDRINNVLIPFRKLSSDLEESSTTTGSQLSILNQRSVAIEYRKDEMEEEFTIVQERIWKPLVCYYFPRFNTGLVIKNWMHLLRKRIAHLQVNSPKNLPLTKEKPPLQQQNPFEIEGIENCEWIYKCPMNFNAMIDEGDKGFCNKCGKYVYKVYNEKDVETHSNLGHCIVLLNSVDQLIEQPEMVLGMPHWHRPEKKNCTYM